MYARFFTSTLKISLTVVYAPTNESTEEAKEAFIEQLQETIKRDTNHDILFIIGDFIEKVGSSIKGHESATGKHGKGERNKNGERLLDVCKINNLVITGTIFPHKPRHLRLLGSLLMEKPKTKLTMCLYQNNIEHPSWIQRQ